MCLRRELWRKQRAGTEAVRPASTCHRHQYKSHKVVRYLEQVENRLADVEEELYRLKQIISTALPNGAQHVVYPRNNTCAVDQTIDTTRLEEALDVEHESVVGITPDATDGVGTIDYSNDETWTYFGTVLYGIDLKVRCSRPKHEQLLIIYITRAIIQHCIHENRTPHSRSYAP